VTADKVIEIPAEVNPDKVVGLVDGIPRIRREYGYEPDGR
jgi:hypothetical protein